MTYYPRLGLTDGQVAYSIAQLLLIDARINNLAMPGFPSVVAKLVGEQFEVRFEKNGLQSEALILTLQEARRLCKRFSKEELTSANEREIFLKVQDKIAKFEGFSQFSN